MIELIKNMKPVTKIFIVVCVTAIIMALIFTDQISPFLELLK